MRELVACRLEDYVSPAGTCFCYSKKKEIYADCDSQLVRQRIGGTLLAT